MTYEEFIALPRLEQHLYVKNTFKASSKSIGCRRMVHDAAINDVNWTAKPVLCGKRIHSPAYSAWSIIWARVSNGKKKTYSDVTVCNAWHKFSEFVAWWELNQKEGWAIDKDLLSDDRQYGPDTCIFIPNWLNSFCVTTNSRRGELPVGVTLEKNGKFMARVGTGRCDDREYLGCFGTKDEALEAWRKRKLELARDRKEEMDAIDGRIYPRIVEIISRAR